MLLKLMSNENKADVDTSKGCTIISNVKSVNYHIDDKVDSKSMLMTIILTDDSAQEFILQGNAYLMNDNGKTIQSFAAQSY
jgi:hypothetical protein